MRTVNHAGAGWAGPAASQDSHSLSYRPEIDGLRAVAVLSVIAFHLVGARLKGGYLGVDIFFVLSGFLITSIIWRELSMGGFSIRRFYDRRIRRIMPALLLVLTVTTISASVILLPSDLVGFARSLLSTIFFVSNVYFWRDTDYFAASAESKPLLHMWSLGIEEQFYVFFPVLMLLLAHFWRRGALAMLCVLTVGSLAMNMFLVKAGGASPAFFLLPTRAWELGAGAIVALLPPLSLSRSLANTLALVGAALVVLALTAVLRIPQVPIALPAVVGASLLIASAAGSELANSLKHRTIVFVGVLSFSLYLWHWPIIVLLRYYLTRELDAADMALAVALTAGAALASWRFVEAPLRDKSVSIVHIRWGVLAIACALIVAAGALLWSKGLPQRLSPEVAVLNEAVGTHYRCPVSGYVVLGSSRACVMNLPSGNPGDADVVLLGNSHAQMFAPEWSLLLVKKGLHGLLVPLNGCLPTTAANLDRECLRAAERNLQQVLALPKVETVVLGFTWWHARDAFVGRDGRLMDNTGNAALITAVDDLIANLEQAGKKVILIGPVVQPNWEVASVMSRSIAFGHPTPPTYMPAAQFRSRFGGALSHYKSMGARFVRPDLLQCGPARCDYILQGRSLFSDANHLAAAELPRYRPMFEKAFLATR